MLSCRDVAVLLSKDADRELSRGEWLRLKGHLLICSSCRRIKRQLQRLRTATAEYGEDLENAAPNGAGLSEQARAAIKARLEEEEK